MYKYRKVIFWIIIMIVFLSSSFMLARHIGKEFKTDEVNDKLFDVEATTIHINAPKFCLVCQEKGLKSRVYYEYSNRTLMEWETYWDEEGNYHSGDPNHTTSYFHCSLGHEWYEVDYGVGKTSLLRITKDTEDEPEKIIDFYSDKDTGETIK